MLTPFVISLVSEVYRVLRRVSLISVVLMIWTEHALIFGSSQSLDLNCCTQQANCQQPLDLRLKPGFRFKTLRIILRFQIKISWSIHLLLSLLQNYNGDRIVYTLFKGLLVWSLPKNVSFTDWHWLLTLINVLKLDTTSVIYYMSILVVYVCPALENNFFLNNLLLLDYKVQECSGKI